MSDSTFALGFIFALGFVSGSVFNLIVIYFIRKLLFNNHTPELSMKTIFKELEQIEKKKEQQLHDLSLTIQNLHVNPTPKEKVLNNTTTSSNLEKHYNIINNPKEPTDVKSE